MALGGAIVVPMGGSSGMTNNQKSTNYVCNNITDRDALILSPGAKGSIAQVKDASQDPTVDNGSATYSWDGENWTKISESEGLEYGRGCTKLSPDAHTFGIDNIVGGYPAQLISYDNVTKKITLKSLDNDDLIPEIYAPGKDIYIILNTDGGIIKKQIAGINAQTEYIEITLTSAIDEFDTVAQYVEGQLIAAALVEWTDCTVTSRAAGEKNVVAGESASAEGSYNLIGGLCSSGKGVFNILGGDISSIEGNSNKGLGHVLHIRGVGNKLIGNFGNITGSQNSGYGDGLFISGSLNNISGDNINVTGFSNTISGKNITVAGLMNENTADYTHTHGYRLKNQAKFAVMLGRDAELVDSPENEGAFAIGGGDVDSPEIAFIVRSRKKVLNPLYNSSLDGDSDGIDDNGEKQYLPEKEFSSCYQGRLTGTTETISNASGSVALNHGLYNRWKITPSTAVTPFLTNWQDNDFGKLIIYNGGTYFQFPVAWNWIGSQPSLTSNGYDVFTIEQIDNDIYIKHEVSK